MSVQDKIISELTEVLPSPDVHVGVVLAQVVEPALIHDENPTSDDRSPEEEVGKESFTSSNLLRNSRCYLKRLNSQGQTINIKNFTELHVFAVPLKETGT